MKLALKILRNIIISAHRDSTWAKETIQVGQHTKMCVIHKWLTPLLLFITITISQALGIWSFVTQGGTTFAPRRLANSLWDCMASAMLCIVCVALLFAQFGTPGKRCNQARPSCNRTYNSTESELCTSWVRNHLYHLAILFTISEGIMFSNESSLTATNWLSHLVLLTHLKYSYSSLYAVVFRIKCLCIETTTE